MTTKSNRPVASSLGRNVYVYYKCLGTLPPHHHSFVFRTLFQHTRLGRRQLRKSPGFAVVVIGSLALGIGASVAIFSVVRAVLLDPTPYRDANRMVHVELTQKNSSRYEYLMVNTAALHDLQQLAAVDNVFLMNSLVKRYVQFGVCRPGGHLVLRDFAALSKGEGSNGDPSDSGDEKAEKRGCVHGGSILYTVILLSEGLVR